MAGTKITRICPTCSDTFQIYKSRLRPSGNYCSYKCYWTPKQTTPEEFWAKVDRAPGQGPQGQCWTWTAGRSDNGYGAFYWRQRQTGTHRIAYELTHGPIPEGIAILHECDYPPCCNPAHLFAGTGLDNMTDKTNKGRATHGTEQHCAKLNDETVRYARAAYQPGVVSYRMLADQFGVHLAVMRNAIIRKTWKHVV